MNRILPALLAACAATLSMPALAQHDHHAMAAVPAATAPDKAAAMTDGIVKRVDKTAQRVTISHEALLNLDMPKMTMAFRVRDPKWLDAIKEGDRIRFVAENANGALTVVRYEPAR